MIAGAARLERRSLQTSVAVAGVTLLTLVVALNSIGPYLVGAFQDDGIYAILGRALATGAGYRYIHLPGQPPATHYPPAYPAVLAFVWWLAPRFPDNVLDFERANAVLLALAAGLSVGLARRARLPMPWAIGVAVVGAISIPALSLVGMVLSESCFLPALVAALLATDIAATPLAPSDVERPAYAQTAALALAAGALAGTVALVRSVGAVIIPAAIVVAALRKQWRSAGLMLLGAVVVLAPWQLWVLAHRGTLAPVLEGQYGTYSAWLGGALHRHGPGFALATARINIGDLVALCAVQLAPGLPFWCKVVALVAATILMVAGAAVLARRLPALVIFALLYSVEVVFWPFDPFRFVWAVWLLIVLALAAAAQGAFTWRPTHAIGRTVRGAVLVAGALVGIGMLRYDVMGFRHHWWTTMRDELSERTARPLRWVADHRNAPEITVTDAQPTMYLYTGRIGVPCNAFTPDEYVLPRDTSRDRAVLSRVLDQFPIGSVIASDPTCALAALRIAGEPSPRLAAIDTLQAGLAVFIRTRYDHSDPIATAAH